MKKTRVSDLIMVTAATAVVAVCIFAVLSGCTTEEGDTVVNKTEITNVQENSSKISPSAASYGFYVDAQDDNGSNLPSTEVIRTFEELWRPGTSWDNGTKLNESVLNENISKSYQIASSRTSEMEEEAYNDDYNDQTYSMFEGLEEYRDAYLKGIGSSEVTKNDEWSFDSSSELSDIEKLVVLVRQEVAASTSPAKKYYKYPRPFRWNVKTGAVINTYTTDSSGNKIYDVADGQVQSTLTGAIKKDPSNDGGFPSGHTNAAYLTSIALAYAVPQKFDSLIMRAGKLGYNRVVAGMHSPLDVMGGRMTATAVATYGLYTKDSSGSVKKAAYEKAQESLVADWSNSAATSSDYEQYQKNLETYNNYSTFGFSKISSESNDMKVPKGAEILIETRFPYLDSQQHRWILYSTGFESGYPVLDDEEGWGRLNLYKAGHGYAEFDTDVIVNMKSSDGGFCALDNWMNDISGDGSLSKTGSGTLVLAGNNSFAGGVTINGGTLVLASKTAAGSGNFSLINGTAEENFDGEVDIAGDYSQNVSGTLKLALNSDDDLLKVSGKASLAGNLEVTFENGYSPSSVAVLTCSSVEGVFSNVTAEGYTVSYSDTSVVLSKE